MKLINPEVRIETTNICNTHCTICPREKMTRPKLFMPPHTFKMIVDEAETLGAEMITLFGYGEPLKDELICDRVKYCSDKGLKTFITTNGSLLDVNTAFELLANGLNYIRFSVHGIHETYNQVHKLDFDDLTRKINNFVAINKTTFKNQCQVSISVIPMHEEEIEQIKLWWKGGYKLEIWQPHNWTIGRNFRKLTKKRKKSCGRPFNGPVQINCDGNVIVCCFDFNGEMVMGNIYENSIEEILKGEKFNKIRKAHENGNLKGLLCETCDQLNIGDKPLLYSNVDESCEIGKTSSTKFKLQEK